MTILYKACWLGTLLTCMTHYTDHNTGNPDLLVLLELQSQKSPAISQDSVSLKAVEKQMHKENSHLEIMQLFPTLSSHPTILIQNN